MAQQRELLEAREDKALLNIEAVCAINGSLLPLGWQLYWVSQPEAFYLLRDLSVDSYWHGYCFNNTEDCLEIQIVQWGLVHSEHERDWKVLFLAHNNSLPFYILYAIYGFYSDYGGLHERDNSWENASARSVQVPSDRLRAEQLARLNILPSKQIWLALAKQSQNDIWPQYTPMAHPFLPASNGGERNVLA